MSDLLKKVLTCLLLISFLLASLVGPKTVNAASVGPWYNQNLLEWYDKVYNSPDQSEIFGERYTAAQVDWIIYSVLTWLPTKMIGPGFTSCGIDFLLDPGGFGVDNFAQCIVNIWEQLIPYNIQDSNLATKTSDNKSFFQFLTSDRPLSGITYFKNLARKFHIIPETQAQGFGFATALDPIQGIWAFTRNVSYGLFVLVTLITAFMIMFRVKLSPQTAITVQSALPRIILTIILVTFSFAIAGFLVDLMYVVIGLFSLVIGGGNAANSITIFNDVTRGWGGTGVFGFIFMYLGAFGILLLFSLFSVVGLILLAVVVLVPHAGFIAIIVTAVIILVIFIILIWNALKIIFLLFKTYANIVLLTIFAPLQLTLGAVIPGLGFSAWIRSFASNLAVFIVVGLLFELSLVFISFAIAQTTLGSIIGGFTGPFPEITVTETDYWPPLLGSSGSGIVLLFTAVSFVLFTIIPKTAEIIQSIIRGQPFAYGTAVGEALGPVLGPARYVGGLAGTAGTDAFRTYLANRLPDIFGRGRDTGTVVPPPAGRRSSAPPPS